MGYCTPTNYPTDRPISGADVAKRAKIEGPPFRPQSKPSAGLSRAHKRRWRVGVWPTRERPGGGGIGTFAACSRANRPPLEQEACPTPPERRRLVAMGLDEIEASLADSLGHKNMTKLLMQISFGVMISYIIFTFLYSQFFRVRAWVRPLPPPPFRSG